MYEVGYPSAILYNQYNFLDIFEDKSLPDQLNLRREGVLGFAPARVIKVILALVDPSRTNYYYQLASNHPTKPKHLLKKKPD